MPHAVRQSQACPVAVDWLDLPGQLTAVGTGRLGLVCTQPDQGWHAGTRAWWERDPQLDLHRLAHVYGATQLLCALDAAEAQLLHDADLEPMARAVGLRLRAVVVQDTPDDESVAPHLDEAIDALAKGDTVLLLATAPGRAELLAAAILVRQGLGTGAALATVGQVRPGLPRRPAQMAFLARQVPQPLDQAQHPAMTVYYHRHCPDGAAAAWVARTWCETHAVPVQLVALGPNEAPNLAQAAGTQVLMLDVCSPAESLDGLHATAAGVTVLDHHKTSEPLAEGRPWVHIESGVCGAMLAWRWFHGDEPAPVLIEYVQDMDLWRNELPGTHAVQRLLRNMLSPEQVPAVAEQLAADLDGTIEGLRATLETDRALMAQYAAQVTPARLGDVQVYAVFVPSRHAGLASDIGNAVAEQHDGVAVVWRREGGTFRYSLRSVPHIGPDVSQIAQHYGGGGHVHASGCKAARQLLQFEHEPARPIDVRAT